MALAVAAAFAHQTGGGEVSGDALARWQATRLVGVALPAAGWAKEGDVLVQRLAQLGYGVRVHYASDAPTQVAQVRSLLDGGADALVAVPVDAGSLDAVLEQARGRGVVVVPYEPDVATDVQVALGGAA
ncbi:substrate-binding domain-containing protein [Cellulomonas biazotea]|jgi:putative multiple sugar transport system substrate-binding protein|uniref:Periplasmic binding protein domain-containing protein n=2 Tax=Cellulomonas biazotea TaxID=1709 RepID=A0A402DWL9_9CELL|nr:hypothetical protein CBZ_35690 [Cellulomonas biazotea]